MNNPNFFPSLSFSLFTLIFLLFFFICLLFLLSFDYRQHSEQACQWRLLAPQSTKVDRSSPHSPSPLLPSPPRVILYINTSPSYFLLSFTSFLLLMSSLSNFITFFFVAFLLYSLCIWDERYDKKRRKEKKMPVTNFTFLLFSSPFSSFLLFSSLFVSFRLFSK